MKLFKHFSKVIHLLTPGEKGRLVAVAFAAMFMALIEVIGIGSIMPFMSVAAKPEIIHTNSTLKFVYDLFGFSSDINFIIFLGVGVLTFLIVTNVSQALMHYIKIKFTSMRRHTLSLRLMQGYLRQEYVFFLNRNSHEFVKNLNSEIQQMINGTLMQFVDLLSKVFQVTLLTVFLFLVNPVSTLGITVAVITIYGVIYLLVKNVLRRLGTERFELFSQRAKIVSEAFWGMKEVKITGTESVFIEQYIRPSRQMALNESTNEIIGDVPKFALETVAFSSIMLFVLITLIKSGTFADVAGTITLYAYAGYRMIPAVQGLFKAITKLRYGAPTAERMIKEFETVDGGIDIHTKKIPVMPFIRSLELRNISFAYPGMVKPVLPDLSLVIQVNTLVGLAGSTGSGKTTLVDIILGLLHPQSGVILADGQELSRTNIRSWQKKSWLCSPKYISFEYKYRR